MTEHELRDKIVEGLTEAMKPIEYGGDSEHAPEVHYLTEEEIADALIAAVIGDVSEWKHRAEVAERAFDKATDLAYEYRTEADSLSCSSCPMLHIFDSCKERGLYKNCSKRWKEELLRQAEKELQEERKDD